MTLAQLLDELRKARAPSSVLDREMAKVAGWTRTARGWLGPDGVVTREPPRFTGSIDEAARARPPGYSYGVRESGAHGGGDAEVWNWRLSPGDEIYRCPMASEPGRSAALALGIACMMAWQYIRDARSIEGSK